MTLSRVIMVLSLAVLAFVLYNTINETEEGLTNTVTSKPLQLNNKKEKFSRDTHRNTKNHNNKSLDVANSIVQNMNSNEGDDHDHFVEDTNNQENFESRELEEGFNYEDFDPNPLTNDDGAPVEEVNDSITNTEEGSDDLEIDGTDLLAAPLVDRFHSLNSIANVNRNSSQDLRGDIEITYNNKYTPFYASHIYGEPLHVNKLH
tara:strand:+ start:807 stop:1418 length:612 start_codon:yes stop_codon:yes gene_type:complete